MRRAKAFPVAVALGLGLAAQAAAQPVPSPPALKAANALIDDARHCSDSSAETFAKVGNETADTIAAAFDKCGELWETARSSFLRANVPKYSAEQLAKDPYLNSALIRYMTSDDSSLEHWREEEIRRLRVRVLELRSKATSP